MPFINAKDHEEKNKMRKQKINELEDEYLDNGKCNNIISEWERLKKDNLLEEKESLKGKIVKYKFKKKDVKEEYLIVEIPADTQEIEKPRVACEKSIKNRISLSNLIIDGSFTNANLEGADFEGSTLSFYAENSNFTKANFNKCTISRIQAKNCNFSESNFSNVNCNWVSVENSTFNNCNFTEASLIGFQWHTNKWDNIVFKNNQVGLVDVRRGNGSESGIEEILLAGDKPVVLKTLKNKSGLKLHIILLFTQFGLMLETQGQEIYWYGKDFIEDFWKKRHARMRPKKILNTQDFSEQMQLYEMLSIELKNLKNCYGKDKYDRFSLGDNLISFTKV